jgi:anti-anti-sigma factor
VSDGQALVLQPTGRLDAESCNGLRHQLAAAFAAGVTDVTVDLSQVSAADITGLGVLAGAARHLAKQGGSLVVAHPSGPALHALRINDLQHLVAPVAAPVLSVLPGSGSGPSRHRPRRLAAVPAEVSAAALAEGVSAG